MLYNFYMVDIARIKEKIVKQEKKIKSNVEQELFARENQYNGFVSFVETKKDTIREILAVGNLIYNSNLSRIVTEHQHKYGEERSVSKFEGFCASPYVTRLGFHDVKTVFRDNPKPKLVTLAVLSEKFNFYFTEEADGTISVAYSNASGIESPKDLENGCLEAVKNDNYYKHFVKVASVFHRDIDTMLVRLEQAVEDFV